jgi:hypothetical protein
MNDEFLKIGLFRLVNLTAQIICDSQQDGEGEISNRKPGSRKENVN